MTTQQHPITPPPELVQQWDSEAVAAEMPEQLYITTAAARWGADQELEACCAWFKEGGWNSRHSKALRAARRPKPLSLKEQALNAARIELLPDGKNAALIIRALEALPDD